MTDWRFGERSDIDEITREEAKRFAESVNLGQLVKEHNRAFWQPCQNGS